MRRTLAGALLALMLAAALICPAWGEDFRPLLENRPLTAGDSVSDWLAIASGRAGLQRPDYLRDLESYVTSMYRENGGLDRIKATEWHRITLAVQAQGGDPTAFGRDREGKPIDLVAEGTYNWSRSRSLGAQGLNGWIFALITLDSGGFAVPEGAAYTREDMRRAILSAQTEEGAFGLSAGTADVDITAMALQALAPIRRTPPRRRPSAGGWRGCPASRRKTAISSAGGTPTPKAPPRCSSPCAVWAWTRKRTPASSGTAAPSGTDCCPIAPGRACSATRRRAPRT